MKLDIERKRSLTSMIVKTNHEVISLLEECARVNDPIVKRILSDYESYMREYEEYGDRVPEEYNIDYLKGILSYQGNSKERSKLMELISRHIMMDLFNSKIYGDNSLYLDAISENLFQTENVVSDAVPLSLYYNDSMKIFPAASINYTNKVYAKLTKEQYTEIFTVPNEYVDTLFESGDSVIVFSNDSDKKKYEYILLSIILLTTLSEILNECDIDEFTSLLSFKNYCMRYSSVLYEFLIDNVMSSQLKEVAYAIDDYMTLLINEGIEQVVFDSSRLEEFVDNIFIIAGICYPQGKKVVYDLLSKI